MLEVARRRNLVGHDVVLDKARLIIPFWGEQYIEKVLHYTLPALLSAGNLPKFAESFDLQVVIVNESKNFKMLQKSDVIERLLDFASIRFVPIDGLLTQVSGEYGPILTYAYWLGFRDLGPKVTDFTLLFLNADFIVANGAYSHLACCLNQGNRLILAPSFRVNSEEIAPLFSDRVDGKLSRLSIPPREMASLAFRHKHSTVEARTVNQKGFHLKQMDQYYWYIDDDTMIGYQHPVALVAVKPEREIIEPTLMWDFSFVPDFCPTESMKILNDSDDFFMIELQEIRTGEELVCPGWLSADDMVLSIASWSTNWQRECMKNMLTFHAKDLPAEFQLVEKQSRQFMNDISSRLEKYSPKSHLDHPFSPWFKKVAKKFVWDYLDPPSSLVEQLEIQQTDEPLDSTGYPWAITKIYDRMFGRPPYVKIFHPLWHEMELLLRLLPSPTAGSTKSNLFITSDSPTLFRYYKLVGTRPLNFQPGFPGLLEKSLEKVGENLIEFCFIEIGIEGLPELRQLCRQVRPCMVDTGKILIYVRNHNGKEIANGNISALFNSFPNFGLTQVSWLGTKGHLRVLKSLNAPQINGKLGTLIQGLKRMVAAPNLAWINSHPLQRKMDVFDQNFTAVIIETSLRYPLDENT